MSLSTEATAGTAGRFYPLVVTDVRRETASAVSVAFEIPAALRSFFAFRAGQYVTIRHRIDGEEVRRCYSICVPPTAGELRIAIKRIEGGIFSSFANTELAPGDRLDVSPPEGRFAAAAGSGDGRRHLAIAAGSGITPILAILGSVLQAEPTSEALLLYASRSTPEILFRETLEDLKDRYLDRFALVHVLSREEQEIGIFAGRLDAAKTARLVGGWADPATIDAAYICGPDGLITMAQAALGEIGVPRERLHVERFAVAGEAPRQARPPAAQDAPAFALARIVHDGKTSDVAVAEGEAVLDAALRAGLDLPWSCRAGMCCTCRARLVDGAAEMRQNFSLEPWEIEAGYVLTCQAVPSSARLVVDYDAA
ncbi:MAG: 2Fe-2S iron-sulfur cluster binding domain-containing protein [Rhodospirillales bacterium]|nr:2Fe-2S iron-sulfur cluster binding domain-containing protein [Rhodospirillales bacterium]